MKARVIVSRCAALLLCLGMPWGANTVAQAVDAVPSAQQKPTPKPVPLKVDVVLSRFQGDKKVASLPYTMWVRAAVDRGPGYAPTTLRMGVDVPVGTVNATKPNVGGANPTTTTTTGPDYRHVGTSIDVGAALLEDGRFDVSLRLTDSSIFTADQEGRAAIRLADPMAFRTFSTSNTIAMRDGQTLQFAVGTDKITGEIVKVDVTINSVK